MYLSYYAGAASGSPATALHASMSGPSPEGNQPRGDQYRDPPSALGGQWL